MKIYFIILGLAIFAAEVVPVKAAVTFGSGRYVNLCGSGTVATDYTCDLRCNPVMGLCTSQTKGAVRYVCSGEWNQCLESESNWSNSVAIGNPGCGKTVQLSLYDKQCRRDDGSWDQTCELLGYMVWYASDCAFNGTTPFPTGSAINANITPTSRPVVTVKPTTTIKPTTTLVPTVILKSTPTGKPIAAGICGNSCVMDSECQAGTACRGGVCRNPACPGDSTCFCGTVKTASGSAITKTPETGGEIIWLILGAIGVGILGLKMRGVARKIW